MHKINRILPALTVVVLAIFTVIVFQYAKSQGIDILEPLGYISGHQRDLFYFALGILLIPLIAVFVITFAVIHRYSDHNEKSAARFSRNWQIKPEGAFLWGAFMVAIISILGLVLVTSTIGIDPYRPLFEDRESKVIRVVALPWKWLFIYPDERIATINELVIPVGQPITFELTADAPMSSFWIPRLGGMIYTMEGMVTKLNLMASSPGQYEGKNAEINGVGYSYMKFATRAVPDDEYRDWVLKVRQSPQDLDDDLYEELAKRSVDDPIQHYASADPALFGRILGKFMHHEHPQSDHSESYPLENLPNHQTNPAGNHLH